MVAAQLGWRQAPSFKNVALTGFRTGGRAFAFDR